MVEGDGLENRSASKGRQGFESLLLLIVMGTLKGFPNPPAMVRGEQSSPAPHARDSLPTELR